MKQTREMVSLNISNCSNPNLMIKKFHILLISFIDFITFRPNNVR